MSKGGSENAVIVGGDADLILQGLALHEVSAYHGQMRPGPVASFCAVWGFYPSSVVSLGHCFTLHSPSFPPSLSPSVPPLDAV